MNKNIQGDFQICISVPLKNDARSMFGEREKNAG